ncbi:MAG: glycosyltransferase family 87 protein [Gemmatimonadota bacterium]
MNRCWVLLLLVLLQLGVDAALISQFPPVGRDFIIQLTAGRVSVLDGRRKVYDREAQTTRQAEILGVGDDEVRLLPFNHPPLLLPALGPLSRTSPRTAYLLWAVVSLALFAAGTALLTSKLGDGRVSATQSTTVRLGVLVFFPIAVALAQGQDSALLFLGASAFVVLLRADRDLAAGAALSLTVIRPHIALGLALPFLFARRQVFLGFLAGSSALFVYSLALVGTEGAARALPAAVSWVIWLLFVVTASAWWRALGRRVTVLHVGLLIAGAVVLAPHIHLHDAALLAITATICTFRRCQVARSDWEAPAIALAVASLLLTFVSFSPAPLFDLLLVGALLLVTVPLTLDIRRGFESGIHVGSG